MAADSSSSSALAALGIGQQAEQLYFRLVPAAGHTLLGASQLVHRSVDDLLRDLAPLLALGLVELDEGRVMVPTMATVVADLVQREATVSVTSGARLNALSTAVAHLVAASTRPHEQDVADVRPLDGELSTGGNPLVLLSQMVSASRGDMLWLRPDTWAIPREAAVSAFLGEAIASGRRSRAIYPLRALSEAPDALQARARIGEQIRVISELPTRMFILGQDHAVLPEPLGNADEPRVHVRQRSIVAALTMWFEALWAQATPVPELDTGEARPDLRRFLLEQLVAGASDEVIARKLGISLRTVRRRVATMMADLGVDTRFQLGVEAVRRSWI